MLQIYTYTYTYIYIYTHFKYTSMVLSVNLGLFGLALEVLSEAAKQGKNPNIPPHLGDVEATGSGRVHDLTL